MKNLKALGTTSVTLQGITLMALICLSLAWARVSAQDGDAEAARKIGFIEHLQELYEDSEVVFLLSANGTTVYKQSPLPQFKIDSETKLQAQLHKTSFLFFVKRVGPFASPKSYFVRDGRVSYDGSLVKKSVTVSLSDVEAAFEATNGSSDD